MSEPREPGPLEPGYSPDSAPASTNYFSVVGPMTRFVEWDYRAQPDFDEINNACHGVFDGSHHPHMILVPDTGSDQFVLAVSSAPIGEADVQRRYDQWNELRS